MNTATPAPNADFSALLQRARRGSRYVQRLLDGDTSLPPWLQQHYGGPCTEAEMRDWLGAMPCATEEELARALRRLRKLVMLKLLTRDLGGLADLDEVMQTMTALAEIAVQHAQDFAMRTLEEVYGSPIGAESGTAQRLLIIGMGKLGGGELNVSSDIDLIFIYPEDGQTNGMREIGNNDFFTRVGRKIINLINELTADGYVFRVDMRLRPYGDSGALVMSFAALEEYLVTQGREWERYAWIKARVISPPDHPEIAGLMQLAQPFVFRKYLDFGAFESMRKLHAQIRQEVLRRDRLNNIKLGPGGIREIEFLAQVFQLIRGGRDPRLRIRPTRRVLQQLYENGQFNGDTRVALDRAYVFLRNLEHRLQYLEDQQTQDLPEKAEDQAIIAATMGFADYPAMLAALDAHRDFVSRNFNEIFSTEEAATTEPAADDNDRLWSEGLRAETLQPALEALGYRDGAAVATHLLQLHNSSRYRQLPELSRQRMDKVLPQFIRLCAGAANGDDTLRRVLKLIEAISRRASYLAFLAEYPQVLQRVADICSASEWAADYLVTHPFLLDELLDAREIYRAPDWAALNALLQAQLADSAEDLERAMDVLRQFHHSQTFHLLAMDIHGLLPLEKLSDHLSDLADLILRHVLELVWRDARKKHQEQHHFAVIAYGKLGGRELGYASDLDLIFLYDDPHPDAGEIYARLAQRINTVLSSYTSAGRLYETDLRLRPNGASGLLVSSIEAFEHYQEKEAWVWEHQALTRARFSAGDASVGAKFEAIRKQVLQRPRELVALRQEILTMRQKMHEGHPNKSELFDIKHDAGGMVDVEFMVQYLVLAYAGQHVELTANSGNLALLGVAAQLGLVNETLSRNVQDIYRKLRREQHRMRLNNISPARVDRGAIDVAPVRELWQALLGD